MSEIKSWAKPHLRQRLLEEAAEKAPKTVDGLQYAAKTTAFGIGSLVKVRSPDPSDPQDDPEELWVPSMSSVVGTFMKVLNIEKQCFFAAGFWFHSSWVVEVK